MLNQIVLVGSLAEKPVFVDDPALGSTCYKAKITTETEETGKQDIDICLWKQITEVINEKYGIGTLIGIKGYLKQQDDRLMVITTRISFVTPQEDNENA